MLKDDTVLTQKNSKNLSQRTLRNEKGLTLVEIMLVLVILGGLFGVLLPRIMGGRDKAAVREARIGLASVDEQLEMYAADCGSYPTTEAGVQALVEDPGDECPNWYGPYLNKKDQLMDPWNVEYFYEENNGRYTLMSLGKDKKQGGSGMDKDIRSEGSASDE